MNHQYTTADRVESVRDALTKLPSTSCRDQARRMLSFAAKELESGRREVALGKLRQALVWLEDDYDPLDSLAEDYVQEHLQEGEAYGCVGKPESYSAEEFANFWLAGAAGDFCRRENVKPTAMRTALIKAWNSRDKEN